MPHIHCKPVFAINETPVDTDRCTKTRTDITADDGAGKMIQHHITGEKIVDILIYKDRNAHLSREKICYRQTVKHRFSRCIFQIRSTENRPEIF